MSYFLTSMLLLVLARIFLVCFMNMVSSSGRNIIYHRNIKDPQLKKEDISVFFGPIVEPALLSFLYVIGFLEIKSFLSLSILEVTYVLAGTLIGWALIIEPAYYWLHRALHIPSLMKHHHKVHHDSVVPRPSADFTFTVSERLSYTILFGSIFLVCNYYGLLTIEYIWFMVLVFDFINHIGHLNVELYPKKYIKSKVARSLIYSTSFHAIHHSKYNYNYSLFMPIWDKIFRTEYNETELFEKAQNNNPQHVEDVESN